MGERHHIGKGDGLMLYAALTHRIVRVQGIASGENGTKAVDDPLGERVKRMAVEARRQLGPQRLRTRALRF
jgi:hypothetical protein